MKLTSIESAIEQIVDRSPRLDVERLMLSKSRGRVLASDQNADRDSPPFSKSMMDGFAVATTAVSTGDWLPIAGEIAAGDTAREPIPGGSAVRIMTGAPVPENTAAVVPVEQAKVSPDGTSVSFESAPRDQANILRRASIAQAGDVVLSAGDLVTTRAIAAAAEFGVREVVVAQQPTVAILATGDELVPYEAEPGPGQIRNSNGPMLAALVESLGAIAKPIGVARDNIDALDEAIAIGLESDVLLLSGGVSAGKYDLVPERLAAAGVDQVFHKVAVKPGKPIWFGTGRNTLVFGLPGNPVSSLVCGQVFVQPAIAAMTGRKPDGVARTPARLAGSHRQKGDRTTYWPSRLAFSANGPEVEPLGWKGSADLVTVAEANSWAVFPPGDREFGIGELVDVVLHCH